MDFLKYFGLTWVKITEFNFLGKIALITIIILLIVLIINELIIRRLLTKITIIDAINLFNEKNAIFIDLRNKNNFISGHIHGSLNFPADEIKKFDFFKTQFNKYKKDSIFVVYGVKITPELYKIISNFNKLDLWNINILETNVNSWEEAGIPLEKNKK